MVRPPISRGCKGTRLASAARQTAVYTEHGNLRARRGARLLSWWFADTSFIYTRDYLLKANAGKTAQITITALRRKEEVRGT